MRKMLLPTKQIDTFFSVLEQTGNITTACAGSGVSRKTIYNYINTDSDFKTRVDDAKETAIEHLEGIALERARGGSDVLLMFLLKSLRPERYRDNPKYYTQTNVVQYFVIYWGI
jgi:hypothetical protein